MPARLLLVFLCSFLAFQTPAQQSCPPIPVTPPDPSALLFSPQQENYLGEIISEHMQSTFLVIDEDDINDYLRKVADRVVRQLPETNLHFQFFLYDQPQVQAFGIPGGRVYVSRKMVAFLRNEDELAGVLGHDLVISLCARQGCAYLSR